MLFMLLCNRLHACRRASTPSVRLAAWKGCGWNFSICTPRCLVSRPHGGEGAVLGAVLVLVSSVCGSVAWQVAERGPAVAS